MPKKPFMEVILGTYEEFLVGYKFASKDDSLTQSLASHSHSGSVRCVAASQSGQFLASGGADDRIMVYDLKSRKEHCMLTHHNSTITSLQFVGNTHLLSGSADGVLAIVRVGNWQLEKIWGKAHKGSSVIDIAVHSTGKLALTLGADCTLRTWNLIKGRQAYAINLTTKSKDPRSLQSIKWAQDDVRFLLSGGKYTEIWSIETGGILQVIEHENKVCCCLWLPDVILVGCENGDLSKIDENGDVKTIRAHDGRIKAIDYYDKRLATCSSNGEVKIWTKRLEEVAKCNTGCRHTCLCLVPSAVKEISGQSVENCEISKSVSGGENLCNVPKPIKVAHEYVVVIDPVKKKRKKKGLGYVDEELGHATVGDNLMKGGEKKKKKVKNSENNKIINVCNDDSVNSDLQCHEINGSIKKKNKRKDGVIDGRNKKKRKGKHL